MATQPIAHELLDKVCFFEDTVEGLIEEIDQTSGSRVEMQKTLDSIRQTLIDTRDSKNDEDENIQNPFWSWKKKTAKKEWSAGFWTEDGGYHNAILKGNNIAEAKQFARKGWGKNIKFDVIEKA